MGGLAYKGTKNDITVVSVLIPIDDNQILMQFDYLYAGKRMYEKLVFKKLTNTKDVTWPEKYETTFKDLEINTFNVYRAHSCENDQSFNLVLIDEKDW